MTKISNKSLDWPEQLDAPRAYRQGRPTADRAELKKALDHSDSQITILLNLDACLDPQACPERPRVGLWNGFLGP